MKVTKSKKCVIELSSFETRSAICEYITNHQDNPGGTIAPSMVEFKLDGPSTAARTVAIATRGEVDNGE